MPLNNLDYESYAFNVQERLRLLSEISWAHDAVLCALNLEHSPTISFATLLRAGETAINAALAGHAGANSPMHLPTIGRDVGIALADIMDSFGNVSGKATFVRYYDPMS